MQLQAKGHAGGSWRFLVVLVFWVFGYGNPESLGFQVCVGDWRILGGVFYVAGFLGLISFIQVLRFLIWLEGRRGV